MCQPSYRKPSCSFLRASSATCRLNIQSFLSNLGIGSQQQIDFTSQQREGRPSMAEWRTNSARKQVLSCLDITEQRRLLGSNVHIVVMIFLFSLSVSMSKEVKNKPQGQTRTNLMLIHLATSY
jgi:hypothetical protein